MLSRPSFVVGAFLVLLLASSPLPAQQPASEAQAPAAQEQPAQQATESAKPADQAGPAVAGNEAVTGDIDFGYRFVSGPAGNERMYRTVVNLGEGPKLFGLSLNFRSPRPGWMDHITLQATSWGGEPYSATRLNAGKGGAWDFTFQYRFQNYFNNIPTFANPLLSLGYPESQNARDFERRLFDADLNLLPNRRVSPFFTFSRTQRTGNGFNTFVGPSNEYLSNVRFDDATDLFRAGTHLNFSRLNATLEAGGTTFFDDERLFFNAGPNPGNRRTPAFGQTMRADTTDQSYRVTGNVFFTRLSVLFRPFSFMDLGGQFAFSQASSDIRFTEAATGLLVSPTALLSATGLGSTAAGDALRPRPSGTLSLELRPLGRVRIVEAYQTNRFHLASGSLFSQTLTGVVGLLGTTQPSTLTTSQTDFGFYSTDYNRNQLDFIVDATRFLTLRAGHRIEWAETVAPARILSGAEFERGAQQHQVGTGAIELHVRKDLNVNVEGEVSSGRSAFFRTSIFDYQKVKIGGRYRPRPWLSVNGKFTLFQNSNPRSDLDYDLRNHETSISVLLAPREGRRFSVALDYAHSVLDSGIFILLPTREASRSLYNQDAHQAGAFFSLALVRRARLNFGGTLMVSDGSRPTRFYQPRSDVFVPFGSHVGWITEWRWYGFSEEKAGFEDFRTHLVAVGLRLTL